MKPFRVIIIRIRFRWKIPCCPSSGGFAGTGLMERAGPFIRNHWERNWGLYTDPYQYMGALGNEMHRAIRLVVDVAMNQKKMTREEAIKYMMDQ